MKRILALLLAVVMCVSALAACAPSEPGTTTAPQTTGTPETTAPAAPVDTEGLENARAYVKTIYKSVTEKTPQDFQRVGTIPMGDKKYTVEWSADVSEDLVKIVVGDDGMVTIDVNEDAETETPYVLSATVVAPDGSKAEPLTFNHILPASLGGNMQAIVDAGYGLADGETLDGTYTLTGVITSIDTEWSDQYGNITVTIAVPEREDKPIMCYRLAGEGAKDLKYGDTITVTGSLKNYKGTIEFDQGCTLDSVVKGDGVAPESPVVYEEIVADAQALAEGKSLQYTATLTGKVVSVDYAYSEKYGDMSLTFVCRGQEFYCYRLTGPVEWLKEVRKGDWVTVMGKIKNYYGKIEFDGGEMIAYSDWHTEEGPEDPLTHIDEAAKLGDGELLPYKTTLTGTITEISDAWNSSYKNISVMMDVEGREGTIIECYRLSGAGAKDLGKGDKITVLGTLSQYEGNIQFAQGCTLVDVVKNENPEVEPVLAEATKLTEAPKTGDIVVIYYDTFAMGYKDSTKQPSVQAELVNGKLPVTAQMAQLTVLEEEGVYYFLKDGKYLASTGTGNNLCYSENKEEGAWTVEANGDGTFHIISNFANYNGNYNQAIEYYGGFTTYGLKDTEIYDMQLFLVGNKSVHVHAWGEGEITTAATCTAEGVKTYTCECGETKTEAIAMLEHTYAQATCTVPMTCTVCGATSGEPLAHTYGEWVEETPATAEKDGVEKRTCTNCDAFETRPVKYNHVHSYTETVTDPTCTEDGYTTYTCECGHTYTDNKIGATGHAGLDDVKTTLPTWDAAGEEYAICIECGEKLIREEYSAAKEILDELTSTKLSYKHSLTGEVVAIIYPYYNGSATIDMKMPDGTIVEAYRMKGEDAANIGIGNTITVEGNLKDYNGLIELDTGCELVKREGDQKPPVAPAAAEIMAEAAALANGKNLPYIVTLSGVISEINGSDYVIAVDGTNATITAKSLKADDGLDISNAKAGDKITVKGIVTNYSDTGVQLRSGCVATAFEAVGPADPIVTTATLMTEAPKAGDVVLIYNKANTAILGNTASGKKLAAVSSTAADNKLSLTAAKDEDVAKLTVVVEGEAYYFVTSDGKYLVSNGTGNNLSLSDNKADGSWKLEQTDDGAWHIISNVANYNGNYNQAIEYYSGFTTYGAKNTDIYAMTFYKIG